MEKENLTFNVIKTYEVVHRGEKRIKLVFKYNEKLKELVKKIPGCAWSKTMNCFHVPVDSDYKKILEAAQIRIISQSQNYGVAEIMEKCGFNWDGRNREVEVNEQEKRKVFRKNEAILYIAYHERLIYIGIPFVREWIRKIKAEGGWWHPDSGLWSFFYSRENLEMLREFFIHEGCEVTIEEKTEKKTSPTRIFKKRVSRHIIPYEYLVQLKLENKSERTIEVYTGFIGQFLDHFKGMDISQLETAQIRKYILDDREKNGYSESYQNQMVSAIRSFYRKVYKREFESDTLPRPHRGRYLPKVLPREDVQRMIDICRNEKHRMILFLLYGFGLRVGEVTELKTRDVDFNKMRLLILNGKGRKDRALPIPKVLLKVMKKYMLLYKPGEYFIEGADRQEYSASSIQKMVKDLAIKAGIRQLVTPHVLRHCYATHMLEKGTDIRYIQTLLGHRSSKTTEIYTHVSVNKLIELANPMDDIKF